jgi:hypothetical protein
MVYIVPVSLFIVIRGIRLTGHVAHAGRGRWWGNLRERDHLEDPDVDGRIILRWIFRKWDVAGMDRIELTEDRDRWRTIVNAVMNLRVP